MTAARTAHALATLACLGVLAACDDDGDYEPDLVAEPTVGVEEAQETYAPLVAAVADAVADASLPGRPDGEPEVIYYAGDLETCVYASLTYEFETLFGESASWDDVRTATGSMVAPEGFELTEQLEIPGGYNGFDAVTDDGTRLEVRSKPGDPSTISLDAPVQGDCDRERSETLPPRPD